VSTEYHKIETLYERDLTTFKVKPGVFKNRVYELLKYWHWTEKIDGTNMRVIWDHTAGTVTFGGRTDNAQIHADLLNLLKEQFTVENLKFVFPDYDAVLYGEGYGAGIQKGGGDYRADPNKSFILFDVLVDGKWWLSHENVEDIANKFGIDVVPSFGYMTIEAATAFVQGGFKSRLNGGKKDAEGLVGRPTEALFDKKGHRLIVKLKTQDFEQQAARII
jgi:ATP-dependent RNA circularization protein (DNA/RNA ligase family)